MLTLYRHLIKPSVKLSNYANDISAPYQALGRLTFSASFHSSSFPIYLSGLVDRQSLKVKPNLLYTNFRKSRQPLISSPICRVHKDCQTSCSLYDKLKARSTHTPIHSLASISRMRTAISTGQQQPWTAVSPLLGQIGMAQPSGLQTGEPCRGECKAIL